MTGWHVLSILIGCVTLIAIAAMGLYTIWSIFTNEQFLKYWND